MHGTQKKTKNPKTQAHQGFRASNRRNEVAGSDQNGQKKNRRSTETLQRKERIDVALPLENGAPSETNEPRTANTSGNRAVPKGLRPWQPGQSGNPAGRPKVPNQLKELARQHTALAIGTLAEIAADRAQPARARVAAAEALLDRGYGRPVSTVDMQNLAAQGGTIAVLFRKPDEGPTIDIEATEPDAPDDGLPGPTAGAQERVSTPHGDSETG